MKIEELSKVLSNIRRIEDVEFGTNDGSDTYEVELYFHSKNGQCSIGVLFNQVPFNLLEDKLTEILKEKYPHEEYVAQLLQNVEHNNLLYLVIYERARRIVCNL